MKGDALVYFLAGLIIEQECQRRKPAGRKPPKLYVDEVGTYRITPHGREYVSLGEETNPAKRHDSRERGTDDLGTYVATKTRGRHYVKLLPNQA